MVFLWFSIFSTVTAPPALCVAVASDFVVTHQVLEYANRGDLHSELQLPGMGKTERNVMAIFLNGS